MDARTAEQTRCHIDLVIYVVLLAVNVLQRENEGQGL
jgi:hypothetical protein